MSHSDDTQRLLFKLCRLFEEFREVEQTMPLQIAYTFILCATYEGESVGDIAKRANFATSTTSRHILDLGKFDRMKRPGYDLVETRIDPMELRRKTVHLTSKGRDLLNKVLSVM
jgi:DNA-binding MarR family transcriptional regulator